MARVFVGAIEAVCAAILVVEIGILLLGVVMRYVFHAPLIWTDELGVLLFIWLAMLGSVLAVERGEHMRITLLLALPARLLTYLQTTAMLVVCLFLAALIVPAMDTWWASTSSRRTLRLPNSLRAWRCWSGWS